MDFTAVDDVSNVVSFEPGESVAWSLAGSFTGAVVLERCSQPAGLGFEVVQTLDSVTSATFLNEGQKYWYRLRCTVIGEAETITAAFGEADKPVQQFYNDEGELVLTLSENGVLTVASVVANLTGSVTGTHTGAGVVTALVFTPGEMTETGAVPAYSWVKLNHETVAIAATISPTAGQFLIVSQADTGTAGHTLTTAGTFDGTNNTATFNDASEALVLFALSSTRWLIVENIGSVGLSSVP